MKAGGFARQAPHLCAGLCCNAAGEAKGPPQCGQQGPGIGTIVVQQAWQTDGTGSSHNGVSHAAHTAGKMMWRNFRRRDGVEEKYVMDTIPIGCERL